MASGLYIKAKQGYSFPDILTDDIIVVLTAGYTPDYTNDEFLSDIAAGLRAATSGNLGGKSFTGAVFNAGDVTYTAVPAGPQCEYLVVVQDTGVEGTSRLLAAVDISADVVVPDGRDIVVGWNAAGIFQL